MKIPSKTEAIDAQLKLFQQRNLEWAQETARLLEDEVGRAEAPLLAQVQELQATIRRLETEREELAGKLVQGISASIQNVLGQEVTAGRTIPQARRISVPIPSKSISTSKRKSLPVPVRAVKPLRRPHVRHLAKPAASIAALMLVGYLAVNQLPKRLSGLSGKSLAGQVAGITTQKDEIPKEKSVQDKYPESFATVAFADTAWSTYADSDFGISLQYPKNATNIAHVVGGANLWFLRNDGYLLKIAKFDSPATQSLDDWWTLNGSQYVSDAAPAKATLNGKPAWSVPSVQRTATSGTQYFVKGSTAIYQVWIKDEPPATDDGQRLQVMVKSLQFS